MAEEPAQFAVLSADGATLYLARDFEIAVKLWEPGDKLLQYAGANSYQLSSTPASVLRKAKKRV